MPENQHDNITRLIQAAENGQLDEVRRLVEVEGVDPTAQDNEALICAADKGCLDVAEYLLGFDGVDPAAQDNAAIVWAAGKGHLPMVEHLLGLNGVNPAARDNKAIIWAAANGNLPMVERLLGFDGVNPAAQNNAAIIWAARKGHFPMVEYLLGLDDVNPSAQDSQAMIWAAANGHLKVVKRLLACDGINPAAWDNDAVIWASRNGHLATVEYLLSLEGVNPAVQDNAAIIWAARKGHLKVVERLLACNNVNPAAQNNVAIIRAAKNGHFKIVEHLLRCSSINPAAWNNAAIIGAAKNGHLEIVERLLACNSVNPAALNNAAIIEAAANGHLKVVERLLRCNGVNPTAQDNAAIIGAARNGHPEILERLLGLDGVNPAAQDNAAIIWASRNGHPAIVERLLACNDVNPAIRNNNAIVRAIRSAFARARRRLLGRRAGIDPTAQNNDAIIGAARNGHLGIVQRLLRCNGVNPAAQNNAAIIGAAENGHLATVANLLVLDAVDPAAQNNAAIIGAAANGHSEMVAHLLTLEDVNPAAQDNYAIRHAILNGHLEVVRVLLADGRVTVRFSDVDAASFDGHADIAGLLEEYLLRSPSGQMAQLIAAHEAVLSYERQRGLFGNESSVDLYLERQAAQQRAQLSELYASESLSSGLTLLRRLVFTALQSHLEATPSSVTKAKRAFLSAHMNDLIAGKTSALSEAAALFNSKEDMYEIASRAVNAQAPFVVTWSNLLTAEGEAGEWVQSYAGNIAREIAASEGQPHYDTCLYALIYRLAEIRRAHNERPLTGTDNPSCFPGTKTRLLKILETHPAHSQYVKPEWKMACYEGAVRYIERVFGEALEEMDSSEEAEALLDALLLMRLENKEAISNGAAIQTTSLEEKVYDESYAEKRLAFIQKVREGLNAAVNAYLTEQEQAPISSGDNKEVYLRFLEIALGENWIAPRLTSSYAEHAPTADSEVDMADILDIAEPMLIRPFQQLQQRQVLQALKGRFYDYCEQHHPEVELSAAQVNAFFAQAKLPSEKDEVAFFDHALEQLSSDESNEGRHLPKL